MRGTAKASSNSFWGFCFRNDFFTYNAPSGFKLIFNLIKIFKLPKN